MKKYEYVTIHIGKFFGSKSEEHRKIIDEYAAKGYRYVGYIPTDLDDFGKIKDMDLIFEQYVQRFVAKELTSFIVNKGEGMYEKEEKI